MLHRGLDRPTVLHTSGYGLPAEATRAEPTRLVDGNQVSLEHRFFTRPGRTRRTGATWTSGRPRPTSTG